ncbi:glutaminyl-peptide cyclotransferase [Psychroflexus sp. YR1-1]|uniref:Glutaminyl-peptide cyclotransferase n=1 Tax=Psychroflexus aurantiacus TaxID=2709310 RepID=A0A6B3R273_9FLAO|nr:glutaminyl-peptide cyclotransferase [Psychroflexus aurantiacus]NEV93167.1 glutaminyl-peptide cyclotransferase [Psychroflexus aurantiacus]
MRIFKPLAIIFLTLVLFSCDEDLSNDFKIVFENDSKTVKVSEVLRGSIKALKDHVVNSIEIKFQNKSIQDVQLSEDFSIDLSQMKLGDHEFQVILDIEGEKVKLSETIKILNTKRPQVYTYEIVNTYPHDINAYTQGLEFHGDTLYESTGQRGESSLRKVEYTTGDVLKKVELDPFYFGEGLTILDGKIYQLTWQAQEGLIYDLKTMDLLSKFPYNESKEGWGLCNDGKHLYKSDGTDKIWILNAESLEEEFYLQPTTNKAVLNQMNELEWVEGKIYANTYQKDGVVIINPENGAVEGVVDFRGLRDKVKQHSNLDVLNGIAYHKDSQRLFVTGKNWNKLFEVRLKKK